MSFSLRPASGSTAFSPRDAFAAVEKGAVIVDIRSEVQRQADGVIPEALCYERNEWRDPASGHADPVSATISIGM